MRKTITNFLVPAVSLLCLLVLGACPPEAGGDPEVPGEDIGQVIIKNIPTKVNEGGKDSFKIYVQFSTSTSQNDPHTAISSGKIADLKQSNGDVVLNLFKEEAMTTPWEGRGLYYIAITISPQTVSSSADIQVKVADTKKIAFSSEANTLDWNSSINLNTMGSLGTPRIQAIYDLIIKKDTEITITTP
jgi:hypothetical protein